jgi:YhcH/YjgK/YiaL family protein
MILDSLNNSGRYTGFHPLFEQAFAFIKAQDLGAMEPGTYPIADGLKAIVSDKPAVSAETAQEKFECHNLNLDIQLLIRGKETMGWKHRGSCNAPKGEYNPEKDVLFYNDKPSTFFSLGEGEFTIFYPEDVHAPMIGEGNIKKMVVKIRL